MLRSKVGYSMNEDSFTSGVMTAKNAIIGSSSKLVFFILHVFQMLRKL